MCVTTRTRVPSTDPRAPRTLARPARLYITTGAERSNPRIAALFNFDRHHKIHAQNKEPILDDDYDYEGGQQQVVRRRR
jgi:hypothetical protein